MTFDPKPEPSIKPSASKPGKSSPGQGSLQDLERNEIEVSLRRNGLVQARAARELGLTQRQIGYRIKKFNLEKPRVGLE